MFAQKPKKKKKKLFNSWKVHFPPTLREAGILVTGTVAGQGHSFSLTVGHKFLKLSSVMSSFALYHVISLQYIECIYPNPTPYCITTSNNHNTRGSDFMMLNPAICATREYISHKQV